MNIEKFISHQIESQFPAIYREDGQELVQFVKDYYRFLENTPAQSIYEGRRLFEYNDIDQTPHNLLLFFQKKYLSDLPFDEEHIRFIAKKAVDFYRRKGSEEGLKLFFQMFYKETVDVYYPQVDILKPSTSTWKSGIYIQLFPDLDISKYKQLIGNKIYGSKSKAEAIVDRINYTVVNNSFFPILLLDNMIGEFIYFDDILSETEESGIQNFGKISGSLKDVLVNQYSKNVSSNNKIGDILSVVSDIGKGAKVIVKEVSKNATGEIIYEIENGGFGYSIENTRLLVSNQIIFLNNEAQSFNILEEIEDQFGTIGVVTGQTDGLLAVKTENGAEFEGGSSILRTVNRANNEIISYIQITTKNDTSPGPLYPDFSGNTAVSEYSVKAVIEDEETVSLITDIIGNFLNVSLDSSNFNDVPPALVPMSGNTNPITVNTKLEDAFDLTPFQIGKIVGFENLNPGAGYINDVFAWAHDSVISSFGKLNQIITLETFSSLFSIGDEVFQNGVKGIIQNISGNSLFLTPYSYAGFSKDYPLEYRGNLYNITDVSKDFTSSHLGNNATINASTQFREGKILDVDVLDSGFGYKNNDTVLLRNDTLDKIVADGTVQLGGTGRYQGFWSSYESHLNGFVEKSGQLEYYDSGKRLQDNDFYQDFSYEISSTLNINTYSNTLKNTAHLAGTKMFGKFVFNDLVLTEPNIRVVIDDI